MVALMGEGLEPLRSDEDVEEILRLAVRGTTVDGGSLRDRLNASAQELGISSEVLAQAERQYLAQKQSDKSRELELRDRKHFKKIQIGEFVSHLGTFLAVNSFLAWIDYRGDQRLDWVYWVAFAWGIGTVGHLFRLFATDKQTEREFQRWRKRRYKALQDEDV